MQMMRLKRCTTIIAGQSPDGEKVTPLSDELPFLQGCAEFGEESPLPKKSCSEPPKIAPRGAWLFSVRAPVGALNVANCEYGIGRGIAAVLASGVDHAYLGYALVHLREHLCSLATGSTFEAISTPQLGNAEIPLPDLVIQRRIAGYLDEKTARIDALIKKKRALLDRLAEKRQALITRAVTRGLKPSAPLKDSGIGWLGEIPAHWEVKPLYRFTDPNRPIRYGIVLPGPNFPDGVPIIKGGDVKPDRLTLNQVNRTDPEIEAGHVRSRMKSGEIVFSIRGSYGDAEIVPDELDGCNLTQDTARISPGEGIETHWLLYALKSHVTRLHLQARALGSTITGVNIFDLRRVPLPVPPFEEQGEIGRFLASATGNLDATVAKCVTSLEKLQEYRTAIVSAAVTGKIKVLLTDVAPKPANKETPAAFTRRGKTRQLASET